MLVDYPIKNDSRSEIVLYICNLHNVVNERLKKPIFDCAKAFDFWGGNCGCDKDKESQLPDANNTSIIANETISNSTQTQKQNVTQRIIQHKDRISITHNFDDKDFQSKQR
jgi:hypothetical protein